MALMNRAAWSLIRYAAQIGVVGSAFGFLAGAQVVILVCAATGISPEDFDPTTRLALVVLAAIGLGADQAIQLWRRRQLHAELRQHQATTERLAAALTDAEAGREAQTFPVWVRWPQIHLIRRALSHGLLAEDEIVLEREGLELRTLTPEGAALLKAEIARLDDDDQPEAGAVVELDEDSGPPRIRRVSDPPDAA